MGDDFRREAWAPPGQAQKRGIKIQGAGEQPNGGQDTAVGLMQVSAAAREPFPFRLNRNGALSLCFFYFPLPLLYSIRDGDHVAEML